MKLGRVASVCTAWWACGVEECVTSVTRSFSFLVLCLRPLFLIWKTWVRSWPVPLMWTWMWWKSTAEQEHTVPAVMEQRFLPPPFSSFSLLIFTLESTSSRYIYIYIWKDTNSGCPLRLHALCLPGSFYSSSFVVEKRAEGQDLHRHCYNTRMWLWERVISRFHVSPDHCLFRQSSWAPNVCFKVFECDCVASF